MARIAAFLLILLALAPAPALASHEPWDDLGDLPAAVEAEPWPVEEGEDADEAPALEGDAFYDEGDPATITDWPGAERPVPVLPAVRGKTVRGRVAQVRVDGRAAIPRGAPKRVRALISTLNQIVG